MANPRLPRVGIGPRIAIPALPAQPATPTVQRPPRVSRPATPPIATGVLAADPEPPIPRAAPPGLTESQEAGWCVRAIAAHSRLRARSFYDTGALLDRLMALKGVYGAANIKELRIKAGLEMSHMTANKYLQIARAFPRDLALRTGIEKCYALIVYANVIGRRPEDAAALLGTDERIQGGPRGLTATTASATAIYAAIKALKDARKQNAEPTQLVAARKATADSVEKLIRLLGFEGASTDVIRRGGEARIAIYVSLETAAALETLVPKALRRAVPRMAKASPDAAALLRAAGWSGRA